MSHATDLAAECWSLAPHRASGLAGNKKTRLLASAHMQSYLCISVKALAACPHSCLLTSPTLCSGAQGSNISADGACSHVYCQLLICRNTCRNQHQSPRPAYAEPATAQPATAEPFTAKPAAAEPATAEPAKGWHIVGQPIRTHLACPMPRGC